MLKNTLKTLFFLCSLSSIAHIAYGMEMEQEPKKLKLTQSQDPEAQVRMQQAAKSIMKDVKENNLDHLRASLAQIPLLAIQILNTILVDGENEDSFLIRCLPLTAAIKKLFDPVRADKRDIDYAIAKELIRAGADLHTAETHHYTANNPAWKGTPTLISTLAPIVKPKYSKCPIDFLVRAVNKRDITLIDFLLENGANPNQAEMGYLIGTSPLNIINSEIEKLQYHLDHGGRKKAPLKTPKIRQPIEKELDILRTIKEKLNYYSEHFTEFNERRKEAFNERMQLEISHRQLRKKDAERIQSQQLLRPKCFEIDFLTILGRR